MILTEQECKLFYDLNPPELKINSVQTTPHLFGWLIYRNILGDLCTRQKHKCE
jgi:hypothetical protein